MKLALITFFIGNTVMLWRPVLLMDPEGGANCSVPKTGLTVSVLIDPPYTEFESGKVKGILGLYLHKIIKNCFIKSPECRLSASVFRMKVFNDTASFFSDIEENKTDLAFPISSPRKKNMSDESYTGPNMHFEVFIKSVEYSLIMDVKNFNRKMNDIVFAALLVSVWPIVVFTLLIAGISGIFVWILVCTTVVRYSQQSNAKMTSPFGFLASRTFSRI